jgi:sigma-E factor negative regulatory protein RseA
MRKMDATNKMDNQEVISALADGQLRGEAFARGVQLATADARAREAWLAYHVIGEVLRTGRAATGAAPEAFIGKLRQRLAAESIPAAPRPVQAPVLPAPAAAANDWRWKLVAGVASVAAMAAVGWNMWGSAAGGGTQPQLAAAPVVPGVVPVAVQGSASTMVVRDPRLDQLLQAHRQLGGATALGNSSGFLRNATFEGQAR